MPKPEGRYVLACDASDIAWGAVLSQLDAEGREHPIAYYSKKLQPSERKWDVWERECACTVWATDKCRWYLLGKEFDLVTDSKVVLSLLSKSNWPTRRANWVLRLSEFQFVPKHRKGEMNPVADFLSRWATTCVQAYDDFETARAAVQLNALEEALAVDEQLHPEAGIREEREEENIRDMSDLADVPHADRAQLDEPEPAPEKTGAIVDLPSPPGWPSNRERMCTLERS